MPGFRAGSARTRALLGVLALVSLIAVFTTRISRKMPDFDVYRTAGARAFAAEPLYRSDDGHFELKSLPAFAIFAAPLSLAPAAAAKGAWFALSAILMLVLLALSLRALPETRRPPALLLVITFLAMAKFYAHELVLGQVNLLFAVLVVLAIVWMRSGLDAAAGLLLALAGVVQPDAAIFAPWLAPRPNPPALPALARGPLRPLPPPRARHGRGGHLRQAPARRGRAH